MHIQIGGHLSSTSSGVHNLRENFLTSWDVDYMSMDLYILPINSFVGIISHKLIWRKDGLEVTLFSVIFLHRSVSMCLSSFI